MSVQIVITDTSACPADRSAARMIGPALLQKSVNSLVGIVAGIVVDSEINALELKYLGTWISEHNELKEKHPFNELVPVVRRALTDGVLTADEKDDILWLCERLGESDFFDRPTGDMQRLHAMLAGIASDGRIGEAELRGLAEWLVSHDHLRTRWPYDEIDSLVTAALQDGQVDPTEHAALLSFFSEFGGTIANQVNVGAPAPVTIGGVCAMCPEIKIAGSTFAFTGASSRYTRAAFSQVVDAFGGSVLPGVSNKVDYLIVGAEGNQCWAYACYGRKVEKALELRRKGARLQIVHENDFHDAIEDLR